MTQIPPLPRDKRDNRGKDAAFRCFPTGKAPMTLKISNRDARRLWLDVNGLSTQPTGPLDLAALISKLGFVQLDSIQNVVRAHHHILWSRNQNYRPPMLDRLMEAERGVFEHFTHDASVLPMDVYPYWRRQFDKWERKAREGYWKKSDMTDAEITGMITRIANEGPLCSADFEAKQAANGEMWSRPPHKRELDRLWFTGRLATAKRDGFRKFYDLAERVIPDHARLTEHPDSVQRDWLCAAALDRLSFATPGCVQRFWDAVSAAEVRDWLATNKADVVPVSVEGADGQWTSSVAAADVRDRLDTAPSPTSRLRILNPFDPAVRDRGRLARLFDFEYRNEIFVPADKRIWGYYVYPLLEGDRFVGRIELKANRRDSTLTVQKIWTEPRIRWTGKRQEKLDAELVRFGRLAGGCSPVWACARPV